MKGDSVFIDTNVLVYAYDAKAGRKHEIARDLLTELWSREGAVLSIQVLQEFFVTVTRKISRPIEPRLAREIVEDLLTWSVVVIDGASVLAAIDLQGLEKISFWDALIVAAAQRAGTKVLLSEDLADGRVFADVTVRNPFIKTGDA